MNTTAAQLVEILSRNKKTAIVALIAAMLVAIVILAVQAMSNPKPKKEAE